MIDHNSLLKRSHFFYNRIKQSNIVIESSFIFIEPIFSSVFSKLSGISANLSTPNEILPISQSLLEKKRLYKTLIITWLKQPCSLLEFLNKLRRSSFPAGQENLAEFFYTQAMRYPKTKPLNALADILSEGSDQLRYSLEDSQKNGIGKFSESLKGSLVDCWDERADEAGKIFKSVWKATLKVRTGTDMASGWRERARKSAENAVGLVCSAADELYVWRMRVFEESVLMIYHDLLGVLPFKNEIKKLARKIREFDKQEILELTWPEDFKTLARPIIVRLGIEEVVEECWFFLDFDEDGIVSVGDILALVQLSAIEFYRGLMRIIDFKSYIVKNGEGHELM